MAETQLVVFKLGNEEYGVNIMNVQEIGPYEAPVKVPNVPDFVEGVMNLRGSVIPVISLKKRFNISGGGITENTRNVVINFGSKQVAFIVDDASEVLTIDDQDIEDTPAIIAGADRKYITGIGKQGSRLLIILDLTYLLNEQEHMQLEAM